MRRHRGKYSVMKKSAVKNKMKNAVVNKRAAIANFQPKNYCPNPLLIDVVVDKVFDNLPDQDLANCLLVCKMWNGKANAERKRRCTVRIEDEADIQDTLMKLETQHRFRISELYVFNSSLETSNFQKLLTKVLPTLTFLSIQDCKVASFTSFFNLMIRVCPLLLKFDLGTVKTMCGRYIKYFPILEPNDSGKEMVFPKMRHFEYISYNDSEEEATFLTKVCKAFPNLRKLVIANMYPENPQKFAKIVMPHLKSLTIRMMPHAPRDDHDDAFNVNSCPCCVEEANQGLVPLGEAHLRRMEGGLKDVHIQALMKMNLQLEDLTIWNVNRRLESDLFKKFIQSFASTLKDLTLTQDNIDFQKCQIPAPSPFQVNLPKLRTLKSDKPFVRNINHLFNSCPNAKSVDFGFYDGADWGSILTSKINIPPSISYISIDYIDAKSFAKLAPMLGTLNGLQIYNCDDQLLKIVFSKVLNIKFLAIFDGDDRRMTQEGFTGLTNNEINLLEDRMQSKLPTKSVDELRVDRPHLAKLKDLCHLILGVKDNDLFNPFAKFVLADCKSLTTAAFVDETNKLISTEFKTLMEEKNYIFFQSPVPTHEDILLRTPFFLRKDYFEESGDDEEDSDSEDEEYSDDDEVDENLGLIKV